MSQIKGFLISFILSFLAFAVIILYGGSFALTLIKEDDKTVQDETDDETGDGDIQNLPVYTTHETFSFALVITDEIPLPEDELPDEEIGEEDGENGGEEVGPVRRETTGTEPNDPANPDGGNGDDGNDGDGGNEGNDGTDTPDNPEQGESGDGSGTDQTPEEPEEPEEPQIPDYVIEFDKILSEYGKEGPSKEVKFVCIVSINATMKKTLITALPGNLLVPISGQSFDLTYANYLAGIPEMKLENFISSLVTANTGIILDYYGYVDIDDFVVLADELGGVPYILDRTLKTVKKSDGEEITIPAGQNTLDSVMLSALLEYDAWNAVERYKPCEILMDVSKGMLDGICAKFRPNIIAKVREMLEHVETDFTTDDMLEVSSLFFSYENTEKNCIGILGGYEIINDRILLRPNYAGSVDKFKQYLN